MSDLLIYDVGRQNLGILFLALFLPKFPLYSVTAVTLESVLIPWARKKNGLFFALASAALCMFIQASSNRMKNST